MVWCAYRHYNIHLDEMEHVQGVAGGLAGEFLWFGNVSQAEGRGGTHWQPKATALGCHAGRTRQVARRASPPRHPQAPSLPKCHHGIASGYYSVSLTFT
jgi:hypothetical protein